MRRIHVKHGLLILCEALKKPTKKRVARVVFPDVNLRLAPDIPSLYT